MLELSPKYPLPTCEKIVFRVKKLSSMKLVLGVKSLMAQW